MVCTHAAADRASPHRLPVRWASQARAEGFGLGGNIRRNHCPRGLRRWSWSWSWGGGGDGGWRQYGCRRWQEEEITRELRGARVNCVSAVWVRGRCTVAWSMLRTHMYTCTRVMPGMRRQPMSRTSSRSRSTLVPGCSPPRNTTPPGRLRTPLARAGVCRTSLTLRCHQRPACEARVGLAHPAHQGRRQKLGAILGAKLQVSVRRRVRVPCALCVWSPRAAESMRCVWYILVFTLLLLTPAVTWC